MLLAKSCANRHHVKNGTLRLGSLLEYRETEIQQIADKEEGLLKFLLRFDGDVRIKSSIFNTLGGSAYRIGKSPGLVFPGQTNAYFTHVKFKTVDEDVILTNSSAEIIREDLNSFIFCMSHIRKMKDCNEIFPNYDDYWFIRDFNAQNFGVCIGRSLLEKIKSEHTEGNFLVPKDTDMNELRIHLRHGNIIYTPRELHINDKNPLTLELLINNLYSMAFIKPPAPFEREKEYRFQYTLTSGRQIIEPIVNSAIIDAESVQRFVF